MKLSAKAQKSLDAVIEKFRNGDLSPVVEIARIQKDPKDNKPSDNWTLSNKVMAYIQTGSLDCRGYRQWQAVDRQVEKGSSAGFILVPMMITVEDKDTGEKVKAIRGFKSIPVFGYHDTDGKDLPEFDYTPKQLPPLTDVAKKLGVQTNWTPLPQDRLGDCSVDGSNINVGTDDTSVFFHELAHACHARIDGKLKGGQQAGQETIADFTACVLMALYGLGDRTGNTWRYVSMYSKDPLRAVTKALGKVEKVIELIESV